MKRFTYGNDSACHPYAIRGPIGRDKMGHSTCGQLAEGREGAAAFVLANVPAAAQACQ